MGNNAKLKPTAHRKPRLVITKNFLKDFETVLAYGSSVFGDTVSQKFKKEILSRIKALPAFPHANPINRFLESTDKKTYRYILYENYYVIYSVTKSTVRVISIIHQAVNPKTIRKIR